MSEELNLDWSFTRKYLVKRISEYIETSGKNGGIVGLSGGIDSSVVLKLLSEATHNVYVLMMPSESTPPQDMDDSMKVLEVVGNLPYSVIKIDEIVKSFASAVDSRNNLVIGNIKARVRMTLLYAFAQKLNYLVIGTGDKSEILLGYFTKYGDGGVDVLPIGDLYKTQVRKLGSYLGLPRNVIEKPSSPALWEGQTAEGEIGLSYDIIDRILYLTFEKLVQPERVAEMVGVTPEKIERVLTLVKRNEHKRKMPEIFKISGRTVGSDWRYPRAWA